eukprot:2913117-Rhodomonas_salina.3
MQIKWDNLEQAVRSISVSGRANGTFHAVMEPLPSRIGRCMCALVAPYSQYPGEERAQRA